MKFKPSSVAFLLVLFVNTTAFAEATYTPPFSDVHVFPFSYLTISYDLNSNTRYLSCTSNASNLVAVWHFKNSSQMGEIPIEFKNDNADAKGIVRVFNNTDKAYKLISCQYQSL